MAGTLPEPLAVVSCHVERPLDDTVWERFSAFQERRPGGFRIAALVRPADPTAGEDERAFAERALAAAARGPLGHHPHWTAPDYARPTRDGAAEHVRVEGARLRDLGLEPTIFCGGGWYTDVDVAEACAELGYLDCTPRAVRPPYLPDGAPWASLASPARVRLPSGRVLAAVPTTHSLGDLARALARRSLPRLTHVYLHDTDLADRRRRASAALLLPLLTRLARPTDLDAVRGLVEAEASEIPWNGVARL